MNTASVFSMKPQCLYLKSQ